MRRLLLSVAGVLAALISNAQTSSKPQGYIVSTAGDTIRGTINIPQFATESGVAFRAAGSGTRQVLLPQDIRAFGIVGGPAYETRTLSLQPKENLDPKQPVSRENELRVFAQVLVRGFASLYQLDYHFSPDNSTALDYSRHQTRFFLFSHPRRPTTLLQTEENLAANLPVLFDDCSGAQGLIGKTRFTANSLAELVLAYNACHSTPPATDLRPTANPNSRSLITWVIRAGVSAASLGYVTTGPASYQTPGGEPNFSGDEFPLTPTVGVLLHFAKPQSRLSVLFGAQAGQYRSIGRNTYQVPAGYANAGEQLVLRNELRLTAVQLPMLAQISLRQPTARLQPFLQVGPAFEFHLKNRSTYQAVKSGFDASGRYLAMAQPQANNYNFNFALGGTACVGLSQQVGKHRVTADVNYFLSRELGVNGLQGYVTGSVYGLRLGVEL